MLRRRGANAVVLAAVCAGHRCLCLAQKKPRGGALIPRFRDRHRDAAGAIGRADPGADLCWKAQFDRLKGAWDQRLATPSDAPGCLSSRLIKQWFPDYPLTQVDTL